MKKLGKYAFTFLLIIGFIVLIFNENDENKIDAYQIEDTINTTVQLVQIPLNITKGLVNAVKKGTNIINQFMEQGNPYSTSYGGGGGGFRGR